MKKMTAILMLTAMLLCTACGNSGTGTSGSSVSSTVDNNSVSQTENNDSSQDDESSAVAIEDSEAEDEGHYVDYNGINYFVPPNFKYEPYASGKDIWSKKLASGSKEYLSQIDKESYGAHNGIDSYNLEDVPEILRESILSDMNEFFDVGATASEITVENEEQIEVLGVDFIKRTGIVHAVKSGKATGDLPYAAYYGLIDMEYYEKVPICWITFSDDESLASELESTADLFAEKLERVEG